MSNFIRKLIAVSAILSIYCLSNSGFAASTSTNLQENIGQERIEQTETIAVDADTFQITNEITPEDPLQFLSIGNDAIEINDESVNSTLFDRNLSTWPYYLLSYNTGTDPEADLLISIAKVCGVIFTIGLSISLIRFFKLRKLRTELIR